MLRIQYNVQDLRKIIFYLKTIVINKIHFTHQKIFKRPFLTREINFISQNHIKNSIGHYIHLIIDRLEKQYDVFFGF